jgi:hypothetical protein
LLLLNSQLWLEEEEEDRRRSRSRSSMCLCEQLVVVLLLVIWDLRWESGEEGACSDGSTQKKLLG